MSRLILALQNPTALRYQEWWWNELPSGYKPYFDEVITLGGSVVGLPVHDGTFASSRASVEFEIRQVHHYMCLDLRDDDVLLVADLSYPGLFSQVLFHRRPKQCYAICHATSRNRFDIFAEDRGAKWLVESGTAKLFNRIFVATEYHKAKLGWKNVEVTGLPLPPLYVIRNANASNDNRPIGIVSVARPNKQKRNARHERFVTRKFGAIATPQASTWDEYYEFLSQASVMLITAREETFGYQVVDAVLAGCIPIAPARYSYPELLHRAYLYRDVPQLEGTLIKALGGHIPPAKLLNQFTCERFYSNTADVMRRHYGST